MLWAYQQQLDPFHTHFGWPEPWSAIASTVVAALPVVVLFWLLVPWRWLAPKAGLGGSIAALILAIVVFQMPWEMATVSFAYGAAFGMLPVGWTIFSAMLLYNITVETGHFGIVKRSIAGLSSDARVQAVLIGFAFGAFLEGAAGGGTPVAICGAILVGLGFPPFQAAVICLIANTSPVAYGGLGTPLIVLGGVTDLPTETLSVMAGHQLPILSFIVPLYMVRCMCNWQKTWEVWPALLVSGGSFAAFQFTFATIHQWTPVVLYPMTDIGGGIFSLVLTAIFLRFWKPRTNWHYDTEPVPAPPPPPTSASPDPHAAEAEALLAGASANGKDQPPLTPWNIGLAWGPYILMALLLLLTGLVRQEEKPPPPGAEGIKLTALPGDAELTAIPGNVPISGWFTTNYWIPVPWLHQQVLRDERLHDPSKGKPKPEGALFNFAWLTAPGTAVFVAALLSMVMLRTTPKQVGAVFRRTWWQMRIPIPTIAFMLGLSYVTRYAGMDATLGYAFANTGFLYPFFAAILGWLGVFLTGTDAGSNALFGSLQKITATQIFHAGAFDTSGLSLGQAQVLITTANSTGGVMGKMIDAQSICVATAATHQVGREADIFKAVVWHSIFLAALVGGIVMLQAYVYPFTRMVPSP